MPESETPDPTHAQTATPTAEASQEFEAMDEEVIVAPKRKLGMGGWICAAWLILMVLIAIFAPMLTAEPIVEGNRADHGHVFPMPADMFSRDLVPSRSPAVAWRRTEPETRFIEEDQALRYKTRLHRSLPTSPSLFLTWPSSTTRGGA